MKEPASQPTMRWSFKIIEVAGISIFMHWTFLILIGWIFISQYMAVGNVTIALQGVLFVLAIFCCVVLHELGHALTARRYGIRTRDITLLPIGGVANLERIPEEPRQELAIAVAGPAVNVVIAALLYGWIAISGVQIRAATELAHVPFLVSLMSVNIFLVLFNIIPAFPMDGGRVLRALLATRLDYAKATRIATSVGQGLAVVLGFVGLFNNLFLLFIAIFVYLGAEAESQMVTLRSTFRNVHVRDAMMTRFRTLSADDSLDVAVTELLAGSQQDFPVLSGDSVVGVLQRKKLFQSLADGNRTGRIADAMQHPVPTVDEDAPLDRTFETMREAGLQSIPVMRDGRITGVLTLENIGEWAMVNSASRHVKPPVGLAGV